MLSFSGLIVTIRQCDVVICLRSVMGEYFPQLIIHKPLNLTQPRVCIGKTFAFAEINVSRKRSITWCGVMHSLTEGAHSHPLPSILFKFSCPHEIESCQSFVIRGSRVNSLPLRVRKVTF